MKIYNIITSDDVKTVRDIKEFLASFDCTHRDGRGPFDLSHACKTDEKGVMQSYEHKILMNLATDEKGVYMHEYNTTCYLFMLSNKDGRQFYNTERFSCAHELIEYLK